MQGFKISSNTTDMDLKVIHHFLTNSYWAKGVPFDLVERAIQHSLCFGVFTNNNEQVGFARMITDRTSFAYLADVFIIEDYRGKGLSKWLMQEIMRHPDLQGLRRMVLVTADAHGLYEQVGFKPLAKPEGYMELWRPDVYQVI
ncbi:GNAT family N-acetyltransferase [Paraneptunicella aestuarii]|uniref:GNAT family N-acetyltransferase n=1 Tax=Paraneptunicella aestuarii TaxID=2831148 RepID=UPI001E5CB630|nr:GNAT family N-acetyltransferase [Paraneptunicella aestuarii]UAA38999.1 GNAT family N-acetyltransferase [Paraneptunicella aestuarii]